MTYLQWRLTTTLSQLLLLLPLLFRKWKNYEDFLKSGGTIFRSFSYNN